MNTANFVQAFYVVFEIGFIRAKLFKNLKRLFSYFSLQLKVSISFISELHPLMSGLIPRLSDLDNILDLREPFFTIYT